MNPYLTNFFKDELRVLNTKRRIERYLSQGWKVEFIMKKLNISRKLLNALLYHNRIQVKRLGNKSEAYFTEEEAIEGFRCDPSELEGWELAMYNQK